MELISASYWVFLPAPTASNTNFLYILVEANLCAVQILRSLFSVVLKKKKLCVFLCGPCKQKMSAATQFGSQRRMERKTLFEIIFSYLNF